MKYPTWHANALSVVVRRIFAPAFIGLSAFMALINLRFLLPGASLNFNGQETDAFLPRLFAALMPFVFLSVGILLYRLKPFKINSQYYDQ